MENVIIFLAVPILILISYLIFINQRILNKVVTYKRDEQKLKINDERYYELNNKIQLIIVISSIILLLGGFFGYNTISTIKSEINNEIGNYRETISGYDSTIKKYNKLISEYESETNRLQKELMQLQSDYSFNVRTYIVSNIKIESKKNETTGEYDTVRVYFKDLKTTKGESLPKFRTPPYLNIQNLGFAFAVMIKKVTNEYFEYGFNQIVSFDDKTGKEEPLFPITNFDLLITVNK